MPQLKKLPLLLAVCALFVLGAAQSTRADPVTLTPGGSTSFVYQSPNFAGSTALATFSLSADGTTLTVTLTNVSTNGTFVSGVGFDTTPNVALQSSSATAGWTAGPGPGGGLGSFELIAFGNGNPDRLAQGESATATFVFTGPISSLTIDQSIAHLTSLPNGQSEKPPGVVNVPEPATLFLLGAGMLGLGAKVRRSRRRGRKV